MDCYIKKSIKFAVSFSLFSFLVSYNLLIKSIKPSNSYFSSFSTMDKNYMFLLCNGILVFLVKNSGLIGCTSSPEANLYVDDHVIKKGSGRQPVLDEFPEKKQLVAEQEAVAAGGDEKGSNNYGFLDAVGEDQENGFLDRQDEDDDEEEEEEEEGNGFLVVQEEAEELLSTEELNKKCDEFIKKMKEGIKWEAQQLVMVQ